MGTHGRVVVFEPNPVNIQCIRQNLALNGIDNVRLEEIALGNEVGQATLRFDDRNTGRGSIDGISAEASHSAHLSVSMLRLDDWLQTAQERSPDFIKIDVEGYEMAVLEGMAHTLEQNRPELWIETHAMYIVGDAERIRYKDLLMQFFQKQAYRVCHVEERRLLTLDDQNWPDGHLHCVPVEHAGHL